MDEEHDESLLLVNQMLQQETVRLSSDLPHTGPSNFQRLMPVEMRPPATTLAGVLNNWAGEAYSSLSCSGGCVTDSQYQELETRWRDLGHVGNTMQATRISQQLLTWLSTTLGEGAVTEDSTRELAKEKWAVPWGQLESAVLGFCRVFTGGDQLFQRRCLAVVFCLPGKTMRLERQRDVVESVRMAWRLNQVNICKPTKHATHIKQSIDSTLNCLYTSTVPLLNSSQILDIPS
jgi:hypothetical protein